MNTFNFGVEFNGEKDCKLHFKREPVKIGVVCKCGNKFGLRADGVMDVKLVGAELH